MDFVFYLVIHLFSIWATDYFSAKCDIDNLPILQPNYDIYFSNIGWKILDYHELPNMLLIICVIIFIVTSISISNYKLFALEHSILLWIRILVISSTIGYRSYRTIYYIKNNIDYDAHKNKSSIHLQKRLNAHYSDLAISGHALASCLLMIISIENTSNIFLQILIGSICSISILSNLVVGDHYTSDIILAIVITVLLHY